MRQGHVYLVGAGPGDPELLTRKGERCLQEADCVIYDRLVHPDIVSIAPKRAERIYCGKWSGFHSMTQEEIQIVMIEQALSGRTVVRLKGGDPSVFGRVGEEAESLKEAGIAYDIVPGISSGSAAPAYAGIPLTHRDYSSSCAFVTGHACSGKPGGAPAVNWEGLAGSVDTIVIYMGVKHLPDIQRQLLQAGKDVHTPVAFIEEGTTGSQRTNVTTLHDAVNEAQRIGLKAPAVIVIGDVAALHKKLAWKTENVPALT